MRIQKHIIDDILLLQLLFIRDMNVIVMIFIDLQIQSGSRQFCCIYF